MGHPNASVCSAEQLNLNLSSVFAQDTNRTIGGIEQPSALDFSLSSTSASDASHTSGKKEHPSALDLSLSLMGDSSSVGRQVAFHSSNSVPNRRANRPKPSTMLFVLTFISCRHQNGTRKIHRTTLLCCCKPVKMDVKMRCCKNIFVRLYL